MRTDFDAIRRVRCLAWAIALVALAAGAHANAQSASIVLTSAWMRPALDGPGSARAYVDIASDTALTLTRATTPVARTVEFVVVATGGTSADETVVATVPVTPGTPTRLAFRGNHLRLVDVNRPLRNGETVPVTLHFVDSGGRDYRALAEVSVRGFSVQVPAAAAPTPTPETAPDPRRP